MKASTPTALQQKPNVLLHTRGPGIKNNSLCIEDIGDYIPGIVMVQDLGIMTNTYMNRAGCEFLRHSSMELFAMGDEYFRRFFPPEEVKILKHEIKKLTIEGDKNKVISFFQRLRPTTKSDYTWFFTSSQLYPQYSGENSKVVHIAIEANMLSYAGKKLNNLVDEDTFVRKNYNLYNLLSEREKQIVRLIVEGESSNKIAETLFLSIHTVNNHRKNILRKLEITCLSQLIKFAVSFGII